MKNPYQVNKNMMRGWAGFDGKGGYHGKGGHGGD